MIARYEVRTGRDAAREFAEWASLFSGGLFVKIVGYIDESGTHDPKGRQKGSSVAVISGLVDRRHCWVDFCKEWQSVLNKYCAPYFHFREWSMASQVVRGKIGASKKFGTNPYYGWPRERLDKFLYELAEIVGSGNKVVVGGWNEIANISKFKVSPSSPEANIIAHPYDWLLHNFFRQLPNDILSGWPDWNEPISMFFDFSSDSQWTQSIIAAFHFSKQRDARLAELTFADKKAPLHVPLQAADMIAFRFRQLAENFHNKRLEYSPLPPLDQFLLKSMFNQSRQHGPGPIPPLV